jgi:hypothetical protein
VKPLLLALLLAACTAPTAPFDCPVDLVIAAPGHSLNVDSLAAVHHPDSIRFVQNGKVAVIATDCSGETMKVGGT